MFHRRMFHRLTACWKSLGPPSFELRRADTGESVGHGESERDAIVAAIALTNRHGYPVEIVTSRGRVGLVSPD